MKTTPTASKLEKSQCQGERRIGYIEMMIPENFLC